MKCKHNHECEQCIRESIAQKERELSELKKKLPHDRLVIIEKQYIPQYIPSWPHNQYWLSQGGLQNGLGQSNLTYATQGTLQMGSGVALAQ